MGRGGVIINKKVAYFVRGATFLPANQTPLDTFSPPACIPSVSPMERWGQLLPGQPQFELRGGRPLSGAERFLTSRPVHDVVLRDEGRYLTVVCPLVSRLLLGRFLFALLRGLLCGGTVVVIVLVLTVVALGVVLGASLQGTAAPGPRVLTLPHLVSLVSLLVPVSVPVLLFVFVFLLVRCHDSPRAFFCPLTAGPP